MTRTNGLVFLLTVASGLMSSVVTAADTPSVGSGVQAAAATGADSQARRTTTIGTRPQEFLLSKVTVSNLPSSFEFYTKVVGLKWATAPGQPPQQPPSASDPEVDFREIPLNFTGSLADPFFVLVKRRGIRPTPEQTKLFTIGFKVPNAREAVARVVAAGYNATGRPPGDGPMAFGFVLDPDGYQIEFVQAPSFAQTGD